MNNLQIETRIAAIPIKPSSESKTRLSHLLKTEERALLALTMLQDVIRKVSESKAFSEIAVISSDTEILSLIIELNCKAINEHGRGLNRAIEQVVTWSTVKAADSLLVLPSDIPLLTIDDLKNILALDVEDRCIVIAPSNDGGTNALLLRPPNVIPPCFGDESFIKHLSAAEAKDVKTEVYRSPSVALDIDTIEDLQIFLNEPEETQTHSILKELNIPERLI